MMNREQASAAAAAIAAAAMLAPVAHAQTLTFEGVGNAVQVGDFYNGGAGGNLGISFVGARALVDSNAGGTGNFANEPSASTVFGFRDRTNAIMNVASGFETSLSFFYSAAIGASVNVYSEVDGTGTLLATLALGPQYNLNCSGDPDGAYCNWTPVQVSFAGTARSVAFGGGEGTTLFDNVALVPEPATWAMMIGGFGLVGGAMRRTRRAAAFA